eukprot:CAMPEP_0206524060 /NCGR_PEP_ID=MMETSP0324_2-20121206/67980_1 /ASSEMBLY_ACC=CAM_ASM_000836 /TAXON_ID=2866 /ORGANISM="Crypthecodinium cohnii, Strain Seligo" /LENGTH=98 /DNA_ID=CAMNT_0054018597 /DNA_START=94 /DNA_END=391 /DNA_ORIENTATION=+
MKSPRLSRGLPLRTKSAPGFAVLSVATGLRSMPQSTWAPSVKQTFKVSLGPIDSLALASEAAASARRLGRRPLAPGRSPSEPRLRTAASRCPRAVKFG